MLQACGSNGWGQLGIGSTDDADTLRACEFKDASAPSEIVALASGSSHTLLLARAPAGGGTDSDGGRNVLLAAGTNTHGQLGPNCVLWNETRQWTAFRPLDLLGALRETLALDPDLWHPVRVACAWSTSFVVYERLPSPSSSGSSSAAPAAASDPTAGAAGTADATPGTHVLVAFGSNDFGERAHAPEFGGEVPIVRPGERFEHLVAGQRHVVAVLSGPGGQRVVAWGGARHGQLGHAQTLDTDMSVEEVRELTQPPAEDPVAAAVRRSAKGKAAAAPRTSTPVEVPVRGTVRAVAVGSAHTLLLTDGGVRAFGSDAKGQIRGLEGTHADAVAASWNGSYVLRAGKVYAQGSDTHGQLCGASAGGEVKLPEGAVVRSITAGSEHLLVLLEGGRVFAGGWNEHGNLGVGDTDDRDGLVEVPGTAERAWAGCATTFVA